MRGIYSNGHLFTDETVKWLKENNIHEKLYPVLYRRGITTSEECNLLFKGTMKDTSSSSMFGVEITKASTKIRMAMQNREKIVVIGYDSIDDICAAAILIDVMNRLRYHYRFQISFNLFQFDCRDDDIRSWVFEQAPNLILSIGIGLDSKDWLKDAVYSGIDTILLANHEADSWPTSVVGLIHPKFCDYPNTFISNAGIALQVMKSLWEVHDKTVPAWVEIEQLDLVAVSVVCSALPLIGDNRIYVKEGIKVLRKGSRLFFDLLRKMDQHQWDHVNMDTILNKIGPRMDISKGTLILRALCTDDINFCTQMLKEIELENEQWNNDRLSVEKQGLIQIVEGKYDFVTAVIHNVQRGHYFKDQVAAALIEKTYRPTFVFTMNREKIRGQGRSIEGINLAHLIHRLQPNLEKWRCLDTRVELCMPFQYMGEFFASLDGLFKETNPQLWERRSLWEGELNAWDINDTFFRSLLELAPTDPAFPR